MFLDVSNLTDLNDLFVGHLFLSEARPTANYSYYCDDGYYSCCWCGGGGWCGGGSGCC